MIRGAETVCRRARKGYKEKVAEVEVSGKGDDVIERDIVAGKGGEETILIDMPGATDDDRYK